MTKEDQVRVAFKVVLTGDADTGKTSLITRITKQTFDPQAKKSNLFNVDTHEVKFDYNNTLLTCIWDLAGGQKYRLLVRSAFDGASGAFLVYDISNAASFEAIPDWLKLVRGACHPKKIMLLGNKTDLSKSRAVSTQDARTFATENGLLFMETSALNGENIELAFQQMVRALSFSNCQDTLFQVVLIDRKSAAKGQIHCVEKPLQGDLKFVALSYRWGELHESLVDTGLGYIASITSFRLQDFYMLCQMMEYDPDLAQMDYVWVDAICVDQSNYERRKATIYHMSEIYYHSNHILAVPDLHLQHLKDSSINTQRIISNNLDHVEYLYNVFHADFKRLFELDDLFLDDIAFPRIKSMRNLLTTYTDHLTSGLTRYIKHGKMYDPISALEHLCEIILETCQSSRPNTEDCHCEPFDDACQLDINFTSHYCSRMECPLDLYEFQGTPWQKIKQLKSKDVNGQASLAYLWSKKIIDRSTQIRQGIEHFMGLIKDWSSRAWVISEFSTAKKKNNLKYWFIQFTANETLSDSTIAKMQTSVNYSSVPVSENYMSVSDCHIRPVYVTSFYKFDFHHFIASLENQPTVPPWEHHYQFSEPVCQDFHQLMIKQLRRQTFLEMMLKSKASRNEDRFYAVFPSSLYHYILKNRDVVSSWNIQSLVSVKLKLYELMDTVDKLNLFFLSGHWKSVISHPVSPTFATSTIYWQDGTVLYPPVVGDTLDDNFDVDDNDVIRLIPPIDNSLSKYCLMVRPENYYILTATVKSTYLTVEYPEYKVLCERLQIDNNSDDIHIAFIPPRHLSYSPDDDYWFYRCVFLIGSLKANKWEIHKFSLGQSTRNDVFPVWDRHWKNDFAFNIY